MYFVKINNKKNSSYKYFAVFDEASEKGQRNIYEKALLETILAILFNVFSLLNTLLNMPGQSFTGF